MATILNADTVVGGAVLTGDASGELALQAAGVTKLTVNGSGVTLANALPVGSGGTGITTTTAYGVVFAGTTANGPFQAGAGPGTATHVLTSNGAGALPTFQAAVSSGFTLGTPVNVSGTSVTFTGIPAGVKQINIMFSGVSLDSTSDSAIIQLGDSGGIETSNYLGAYGRPSSSIYTQFSNGFIVFDSLNTAFTYNGTLILTLQDSSTNTFTEMSNLAMSNTTAPTFASGTKSLSAVLTQIRLTTINGASSFDAGSINIAYI